MANDKSPISKPIPSIGSVNSHNASGGATAGVIQHLEQNYVLPTVVRGPLLNEFKQRFTEGAQIYQRLQNESLTSDEYAVVFAQADRWYWDTFNWLDTDVDKWAAQRFAFRFGSANTWDLSSLDQATNKKRNDYINTVYPLLQNLDQLMREPSLYPSKRK
ncbi:hypothetical protein [uncultured Sphingomonas sp.]|uniref:hypothetical protein n=1 Tax=uncultured Sphingomonas sp. TaxID=158754 RepID=UPI00260371AF|nr:hypothetical protein [uncultured Sphingomonas sp.]